MHVEFMEIMEFADVSADESSNQNGSEIGTGCGSIRTDWTE